MHLTIKQLEYFVEIVQAGAMSVAAKRLHVATTALSQQVRSMEEFLGVPLLERHSRGVRLTEAGRELYNRARDILMILGETERRLSGVQAGVRLGASPAVARVVGVATLLATEPDWSGPKILLTEASSRELPARLQAGEFDVIIGSGLAAAGGTRAVDLFDQELVFVAAPGAISSVRPVPLAEALGSRLLFIGDYTPVWSAVHDAARSAGLAVNVGAIIGSIYVLLHAVMRGDGAAILPYSLVRDECRRGSVSVHRIEDGAIRMRSFLAAPTASFSDEHHLAILARLATLTLNAHLQAGPYYNSLWPDLVAGNEDETAA